MINCVYKDTNGSCAHPGNRNCCAAEETHTFFHKCDKNEKLGLCYQRTNSGAIENIIAGFGCTIVGSIMVAGSYHVEFPSEAFAF
jgi:hypothetical protein